MTAPDTTTPPAPRITFGRQKKSGEIPIYLNDKHRYSGETQVGYLRVCKEIRFDPAKLVFAGVYATLFEVEEEPFFASKDWRHGGDARETVSAAKAWVKAKLAAP